MGMHLKEAAGRLGPNLWLSETCFLGKSSKLCFVQLEPSILNPLLWVKDFGPINLAEKSNSFGLMFLETLTHFVHYNNH